LLKRGGFNLLAYNETLRSVAGGAAEHDRTERTKQLNKSGWDRGSDGKRHFEQKDDQPNKIRGRKKSQPKTISMREKLLRGPRGVLT